MASTVSEQDELNLALRLGQPSGQDGAIYRRFYTQDLVPE